MCRSTVQVLAGVNDDDALYSHTGGPICTSTRVQPNKDEKTKTEISTMANDTAPPFRHDTEHI